MDNIIKRRLKLQQRKAKIITEEARLKIQERKARTHHLIEIGGLVAKVKLDDLPSNSLLGAFISLKEKLIQNPNIQDQWTKICIIFRPLLTSLYDFRNQRRKLQKKIRTYTIE